MKGCIGRHGHLFILRGKRMKPMNCPVSQGEMLLRRLVPSIWKTKGKRKRSNTVYMLRKDSGVQDF